MNLWWIPLALIAGSGLYAALSTRRRRSADRQRRRDLATCRAIWPDAHRAARIADTQHRLDRRKEKDR